MGDAAALAADGGDLASALATIQFAGDRSLLDATIDDAFPGSQLRIEDNPTGLIVTLEQEGMLRPLHVAELSDGTLRFLLLAATISSRGQTDVDLPGSPFLHHSGIHRHRQVYRISTDRALEISRPGEGERVFLKTFSVDSRAKKVFHKNCPGLQRIGGIRVESILGLAC